MNELRSAALVCLSLLGSAALVVGCMVEPNDPPPYEVHNSTDMTVEIRFLLESSGHRPEDLEDLRSVVILEPGQDYQFGPIGPDDDTCLDAPLVAIGPDGQEVDRLPEGTCADDDVRPTWIVSAEG